MKGLTNVGFLLFYVLLTLGSPATPLLEDKHPVTHTSSNSYSDSSTTEISTPTSFSDSNSSQWDRIGSYIQTCPYQTIILDWHGNGGWVDIGKKFIRDMQAAEHNGKYIIIKLVGPAYSVHALVPCYANRIINNDKYFLMFHADASQFNEPRTYKESNIRSELSMCVDEHVITQKDEDILWQGNEVYKTTHKTWYRVDRR